MIYSSYKQGLFFFYILRSCNNYSLRTLSIDLLWFFSFTQKYFKWLALEISLLISHTPDCRLWKSEDMYVPIHWLTKSDFCLSVCNSDFSYFVYRWMFFMSLTQLYWLPSTFYICYWFYPFMVSFQIHLIYQCLCWTLTSFYLSDHSYRFVCLSPLILFLFLKIFVLYLYS